MSKFVFQLRDAIPHDAFTDLEVASVAAGSPDSRYGLVKRAMAAGHNISLRRGVYAFGRRYQRQLPNPFVVSHWMYRPSYVSL